MQMTPYLNFAGNCAEAFAFYAETLHGEIVNRMDHGAAPAEFQVSPEWRDKIMHIHLRAGGADLFGSDAPPAYFKKPQGYSVTLSLESAAEADRIFAALAEGGQASMAIQKTFWAERFGMVTDRFGTPWIVSYAPAG